MSAGLQALSEAGLDLARLAESSTAEVLTWHNAATKPDSDLTVLLWMYQGAGQYDWESGYWDGTAWCLCESGGLCPHMVTHWALPEGPTL